MPIISKHTKRNAGFTLVEMIVAVALFAIVMTVAAGAIFSIVNANREAQSLNSVISNLNFTVESMLRDIRTGYNYSCLDQTTLVGGQLGDNPSDCTVDGGHTISFITSDGDQAQYSFDATNNQIIKTSRHSTDVPLSGPITAPEVVITDLTFYVGGTQTANGSSPVQPYVLVRISGHAGVGKNQSDFDIQTFLSQRVLNVQ